MESLCKDCNCIKDSTGKAQRSASWVEKKTFAIIFESKFKKLHAVFLSYKAWGQICNFKDCFKTLLSLGK